MTKVAKLVFIDTDNNHLMMYRSDHPTFGRDPDLPGGTVEEGEASRAAMLREVKEEIGVDVDDSRVREIYSGTDYSKHGSHYSLYTVRVDKRPDIAMSWEHSAYEWISRDTFLEIAKSAKDTFMHMVYDQLS